MCLTVLLGELDDVLRVRRCVRENHEDTRVGYVIHQRVVLLTVSLEGSVSHTTATLFRFSDNDTSLQHKLVSRCIRFRVPILS